MYILDTDVLGNLALAFGLEEEAQHCGYRVPVILRAMNN